MPVPKYQLELKQLKVPVAQPAPTGTVPDGKSAGEVAAARREFARLLGEFRRTAVLVPFDDYGSLWTADFNGVRWICEVPPAARTA